MLQKCQEETGKELYAITWEDTHKPKKPGAQALVPSNIERDILRLINGAAKNGSPLGHQEVWELFRKHNPSISRFQNETYYYKFLQRFAGRHADITEIGTIKKKETIRAEALLTERIIPWADGSVATMNDASEYDAIYNLDETGIELGGAKGKAVAWYPRGWKDKVRLNLPKVSGNRVSILMCAGNNGHVLAPFFVVQRDLSVKEYEALRKLGVVTKGRNGSSSMNKMLFVTWFLHVFLGSVDPPHKRKRIAILYDSHSSHLDLATIVVAKKYLKIDFCTMPSNTTDTFQPLDKTTHRCIKADWRAIVFHFENNLNPKTRVRHVN
mmetsp:Transcript_40515/g.105147  ORF Transcript_40515/g.105147 Transcript_40515/m.105147 type:complete len:325 (-) Transcript_40515:1844-2818(-)